MGGSGSKVARTTTGAATDKVKRDMSSGRVALKPPLFGWRKDVGWESVEERGKGGEGGEVVRDLTVVSYNIWFSHMEQEKRFVLIYFIFCFVYFLFFFLFLFLFLFSFSFSFSFSFFFPLLFCFVLFCFVLCSFVLFCFFVFVFFSFLPLFLFLIFPHRYKKIISILLERNPHVACFQEVPLFSPFPITLSPLPPKQLPKHQTLPFPFPSPPPPQQVIQPFVELVCANKEIQENYYVTEHPQNLYCRNRRHYGEMMLISRSLPCPEAVAFTEFECSGQGLVMLFCFLFFFVFFSFLFLFLFLLFFFFFFFLFLFLFLFFSFFFSFFLPILRQKNNPKPLPPLSLSPSPRSKISLCQLALRHQPPRHRNRSFRIFKSFPTTS